ADGPYVAETPVLNVSDRSSSSGTCVGDSVTPSSGMNSTATIFRISAPPSRWHAPPYDRAPPPTGGTTAGHLKPKVHGPDEHTRRSSVEFAVDRDIRKR